MGLGGACVAALRIKVSMMFLLPSMAQWRNISLGKPAVSGCVCLASSSRGWSLTHGKASALKLLSRRQSGFKDALRQEK